MNPLVVQVFTDGSCHTQWKVGAWVAFVQVGEDNVFLNGIVLDTTHHRMELEAVVQAIEWVKKQNWPVQRVDVFTDSQYVVGIEGRKKQLESDHYVTQKGQPIPNAELVKSLIFQLNSFPLHLIKIAAHQKKTTSVNYNREVDKMARALVRKYVEEHYTVKDERNH